MPIDADAPPPRYEYRIWSDDPALQAGLRSFSWQSDEASARADIYLIPTVSGHVVRKSIKLRDGKSLDVKTLLDRDSALEQWGVEFKSEFPLQRKEFVRAAAALNLALPFSEIYGVSPAHFIAALESFDSSVHALLVTKNRRSFDGENLQAEICRVCMGSHSHVTLALEGEIAAHVDSAARKLDFHQYPNTSYEAKLQSLLSRL